MSCDHINPPGYQFCGHCGEEIASPRCRCGFVATNEDLFCGRCGHGLASERRSDIPATVDQRFDLERLAELAAQEGQLPDSAQKERVSQDDIRRLMAARKRKA